jgi:hypothetical protein
VLCFLFCLSLSYVFCAQYCLFLWIVHSELPVRFYLRFMYRYINVNVPFCTLQGYSKNVDIKISAHDTLLCSSGTSGFGGVHVTQSLVFCVVLCTSFVCVIVLCNVTIVLSVLLRFTASSYPFFIFTHILQLQGNKPSEMLPISLFRVVNPLYIAHQYKSIHVCHIGVTRGIIDSYINSQTIYRYN